MRNYVDPGNHVVSEDFSSMIIHKKLIAFAARYPEAVNSLTADGVQSLKLEYLVRFAEFASLFLIFPLRTSSWKSADELADKYIKEKPKAIHDALYNLSDVMMENIQILTDKNTGEHDLYLDIHALKEFCIAAGFRPRGDYGWGDDSGRTPKKPTPTKSGPSKAASLKKGKQTATSLKQSRFKELLDIFRPGGKPEVEK